MKNYSSLFTLSVLLSAAPLNAVRGCLFLFLLFAFCFLCVHLLRFAVESKKPPPPVQEKPPKEKAPPTAEPVYYIVEKKRSRAKNSYGEPKQIQFK